MSGSLHLGDFTSAANVYGAGGMPRYYGDALVASAASDPRVVALGADLSAPTETDVIRDAMPDRFFMVGIQEANLIGVASGMAKMGDIPFANSFSVFLTRRCYDQIAMQVAYPKANVKLAGFLPGLSTLLGVSHQAIDDIALMRALPNMTIIEPGGPDQIVPAVKAAIEIDGPVYLRLQRADRPLQKDQTLPPFELGKAQTLKDGADVAIVASGLMIGQARQAATKLSKRGISTAVVNLHTIKPLDRNAITQWARRCQLIVTAENHSIIGGLGSAVAEVLAEENAGARLVRVGLKDRFAEGGSLPYLLQKYRMSADAIVEAVVEAS
ncbi:transketolase family protein [Pelagibius sp. Alg239-R121]|uniref:transketolase family protein n=1 Tax=Pelagibius sp. Alg239-R121 TaxID=2993448 RepID=UPI0024A75FA0|nr:transketolase C-terminal domain-containing protein [Pelagibius sp. Alg239-R121]